MAHIHIVDIEAAINYWRARRDVPGTLALGAELQALAELYGHMVYARQVEMDERDLPAAALEAWMIWYDTQTDTPCIAICSTSQGDENCKGCGRSFEEVQRWTEMSPAQKRQVWRRITAAGTGWRFNRYAERAEVGAAGETDQG